MKKLTWLLIVALALSLDPPEPGGGTTPRRPC